MAVDISLITSLYRSETHLPEYIEHVRQVAAELERAELSLQLVIVANDASPTERQALATLTGTNSLDIRIVHIPRETLYASWNRGIAAAESDLLGFWNVDDRRNAYGLIEAYHALTSGSELVDMPFRMLRRDGSEQMKTAPYDPARINPKRCVGPFFMIRRSLYEAAGAFDEHFVITGDFEWCTRDAVRHSRYTPLTASGGDFILHEANLSNGVRPLEWVEINTVLIWHGLYDQLRPVDPDLMRETWQQWGCRGGALPDPVARWLWGDGAQERCERYWRERSAHPLVRRIRLALARRGLWTSVEWDASHQPKA